MPKPMKLPDPNQTSIVMQDDPAVLAYKKMCATYQRRIQEAIFRISEKVRPSDRARLDAYIRHASPQMARNGDSQFPTALLRAHRDADRHASFVYPGILHFHCGNAIFTFYELVIGTYPKAREDLDRRLTLLEEIAAKGPNQFRVIGTDREGFTMIHRDAQPVPFNISKQIEDSDAV